MNTLAAYWKHLSEPPQHEGLCLCKDVGPTAFFGYWNGEAFTTPYGYPQVVTKWRSVMAGQELEQAISRLWVARGGKV